MEITERVKSSAIIGIAIITTAFVLGTAFKKRNENLDSISVIGLGTKDFVSDEILWSGSFTTKSYDIKEAYNKMIADQKIVTNFFLGIGLNRVNLVLERFNSIKNLEKFELRMSKINTIQSMNKFLMVMKLHKL